MILVTGASGFVGSRIVARLVGESDHPRALVRDADSARNRLPAGGVEIVTGDTTEPETLKPAMEGVDTIIHCAFIVANRKQGPGVNYRETNVNGTRHLVHAAREAGVRRIVVMGGLGTRPSRDPYTQGRYEADQSVRQSGLKWSILGPSVQFGKGSAFIEGLADLIRSAPVVPMVGDGKVRFQPIWIEDVVTAIVMMAKEPAGYDGRYIEIGGPHIYTYAQILDMLMETMGMHKLKVPGPIPFARLGAFLMETVLPNPPITSAAVGLFESDNVATLDSVERNFGFKPMSLKTYLAQNGVN